MNKPNQGFLSEICINVSTSEDNETTRLAWLQPVFLLTGLPNFLFAQGAGGEARRSLQHDPAVLLRSGCSLRRSKGHTHITFCWTHPRLVQGEHRPQKLRATRRPR